MTRDKDRLERVESLRAALSRERAGAWEIAHYERGQRDEYSSKLRFGLVGLNAASMVTVLNIGNALAGVGTGPILAAAVLFLTGTIAAGISLEKHQTHLIELTGYTGTRALALDRAVTLAAHSPDSPEYAALGEVLDQTAELSEKTYGWSAGAIHAQFLSRSAWIAGVAVVASAKAVDLIPSVLWSRLASIF